MADETPDTAPDAAPDTAPDPTVRVPRSLTLAGLAVGVWANLPPFVGPGLVTSRSLELVDHSVPAVVVLAVVAWAARAGRAAETWLFAAGLVIGLAGVWMTATHVPLVAQALRGGVGWAATISHSLPGLAVLALGGAWTARFR